MYSYFNPNPNGRNVSDCTVRAICKATGKDWGEVYLALCIQGYLDGDLLAGLWVWGIFPSLPKQNTLIACSDYLRKSVRRIPFLLHTVI